AEDLAYSGTLGIAREASFWGAPAIGISRVKSATISPADNEWLAELLHNLWKRRNIWTAEGHWLSINLPAVLPAGIRQPSIGRDKIARKAEVVEEGEGETVLVFPRGRAHSNMPGDENAAIDTGFATINRLKWFGETRLNEGCVSALRPQGRRLTARPAARAGWWPQLLQRTSVSSNGTCFSCGDGFPHARARQCAVRKEPVGFRAEKPVEKRHGV